VKIKINKIFCENKNNCENKNIIIHIYIFLFSQNPLFQMPVKILFSQKIKNCENNNFL